MSNKQRKRTYPKLQLVNSNQQKTTEKDNDQDDIKTNNEYMKIIFSKYVHGVISTLHLYNGTITDDNETKYLFKISDWISSDPPESDASVYFLVQQNTLSVSQYLYKAVKVLNEKDFKTEKLKYGLNADK